jgi:SAM-dependent methyltransferase
MKQKYYAWHGIYKWNYDIIEHFFKSKLVLDVGCGTGWIGAELKKYNKDVKIIGLDLDITGLKLSTEEDCIMGTFSKLPFKTNIADGLIAKDILEHSIDPLSIMLEFNRVLKKDGILYISVPDIGSKTFWDDYTHIRPFTKTSIVHLLEDTGFDIYKIWYTGKFLGLGILMDLFRMNKIPYFIKLLAQLKLINRANIIVISKKL